ncbi:unnamed protein product [Choristocarpus tenellus]
MKAESTPSLREMDPTQCLAILSQRSLCTHDHEVGHFPAKGQPGGNFHGQEQTPGTDIRGGQVINLTTGDNESQSANNAAKTLASAAQHGVGQKDESDAMEGDISQEDRGQSTRLEEVRQALDGMPTTEVVKAFTRAQEERVLLYRKFNRGLEGMLQSGDYAAYPPLCVEVTAGFSLLSQTINCIEGVLSSRAESKGSADIIRRIQKEEEQKLTLTAALHLESMRSRNGLGRGAGGLGLGPGLSPPGGEGQLLEEGMTHLSERVEASAAAVRDLLEELRYEAFE